MEAIRVAAISEIAPVNVNEIRSRSHSAGGHLMAHSEEPSEAIKRPFTRLTCAE